MKVSRSEPPIRYLASSPDGDVVIDEAKENTPLVLTRSDAAGIPAKTEQGTEPRLTYGRYLRMVKQFISRDSYKLLLEAVSNRVGNTVTLRDVDEIIIRSEKHGAMYHVAKIELYLKETVIRFAVNVTFSPHGKDCMNREFAVLKQLHKKFPSFLPHVYFKGEEKYQTGESREESALMFLGEWFTGYHEFHLSVDPIDSKQKVIIWDYDHGYKFASDRQGREIYKQVANILTLYYDIDTFRQIFPWHHSAGDFIVRADPDNGQIAVKLITVRGYDPMIAFSTDEPNNKLAALIHFLCNLTVRMRLDRLDGTGDIVWAEEFCIDGVVEGFFDALKIKEKVGEFSHVRVEEFIDILQSLTRDDWKNVLAESLDIYSESDPDFTVILQHLNQHSDKLYSAVQAFAKA
ncbi:MAG: hypothetical protein JRE23_05275 [Deltaproteobacteria bacterium]|nr:hypothetical protein [Deltaproteobacteria bacterium]